MPQPLPSDHRVRKLLREGFLARALYVSALLIVLDLALIGGLLVKRIRLEPSSFTLMDASPLFILGGLLAALLTLFFNQLRSESEEYLESALGLLSKAYEILAAEKDELGRPKSARLNWLTSARLIRTAERIAELVTIESHLNIWEAEKEYWRGRLYDLINPDGKGFPSTYYAEDPTHLSGYLDEGVRPPLSEKSLAVLYRFVRWPKGVTDPLIYDSVFTKDEIEKMVHFGPQGLGELLEKAHEHRNSKKPRQNS